MGNIDVNQLISQITEYFNTLPQDKLFAWIAIAVGFLLMVLAIILW